LAWFLSSLCFSLEYSEGPAALETAGGIVQVLAPLLRVAARGQVSGELFHGNWINIGMVERLRTLND